MVLIAFSFQSPLKNSKLTERRKERQDKKKVLWNLAM